MSALTPDKPQRTVPLALSRLKELWLPFAKPYEVHLVFKTKKDAHSFADAIYLARKR